MYGNRFNFSAPRYRQSGRPFHSDADLPRSSHLHHAGQDPQGHWPSYFTSGATGGFQAKDYVFGRRKSAVGCGDYAQDTPSAQHDDKPGGERRAEGDHGREGGGIVHPCAEEKNIAVATGTASCEYAGCNRTPQYGIQEGLLSFCQDHKRRGMYTVRKGVLLAATRDGSAFRQAVSGPAVKTDNTAVTTGASRNKCEIPDCDVQPSYGAIGTCRPRFCSRHKEEGHVCLKNRPCLFSGYLTRPHYGLPGGRGVFCAAHKEDGMVHLLTESKNQEEARKRFEARGAKVKDRSAGDPADEEYEEGGWEKRQIGKSSAAGNAAAAGQRVSNANKRRKTATGIFSPATRSSSYRTADGSGFAPSDEMRLLLEARESARAAGEAGGSGRRLRVPSRKFQEASGKVLDEGVQWMTKEKREEQARKNREWKEQKKAAAAAGLQVGQVLETTAFRFVRGTSTMRRGNIGRDALGVAKVVWRKLTPAEILRVARKQPAVDWAAADLAQLDRPVDNITAADATGVVTVSKSEQEERAPVSAAAVAGTDSVSGKKQNYLAAAGGPGAQQGSTVVELVHESRPKRSRKEDRDERLGEEEKRAPKAACVFEGCPKKASFGVNGVVRYCKMHRIFGMHKIVCGT